MHKKDDEQVCLCASGDGKGSTIAATMAELNCSCMNEVPWTSF